MLCASGITTLRVRGGLMTNGGLAQHRAPDRQPLEWSQTMLTDIEMFPIQNLKSTQTSKR